MVTLVQLQGIVIYKHCRVCSYLLLKLKLLTSVVVGLESHAVKAALQQCKGTVAKKKPTKKPQNQTPQKV